MARRLTMLLDFSDAGSRDSPLTNHGVLQTKRLAAHLVKRRHVIGPTERVFTSNLQRAAQTAEAIVTAQLSALDKTPDPSRILQVEQLAELREKDFGTSEGKKFGSKSNEVNEDVRSDSESRESMRVRIDRFFDSHLVPVLHEHAAENVAVVIVAHGIILNVLLRSLLARFPTKENVLPSPGSSRNNPSEYIAAWSNTGVLQAKFVLQGNKTKTASPADTPPAGKDLFSQLYLSIESTNNVDHLQGLKKTRGGIGSAKFDSKQRTMDSFFGAAAKKRKLDETTQ
ncbi:phosphoglycerate mutase-like protein [Xylariomycetidae sp. FL2044]|nr:phosphoglycerate mutase-like protein [Xylariomycetidae sp. FL2044]